MEEAGFSPGELGGTQGPKLSHILILARFIPLFLVALGWAPCGDARVQIFFFWRRERRCGFFEPVTEWVRVGGTAHSKTDPKICIFEVLWGAW